MAVSELPWPLNGDSKDEVIDGAAAVLVAEEEMHRAKVVFFGRDRRRVRDVLVRAAIVAGCVRSGGERS